MGSSWRHSVDFSPALYSSHFPISKDKGRKYSANSSSINSLDDASLVLGLGQSSHSCISISPTNIDEQNSVYLDLNHKYSTPNDGTVRQNNLFGFTMKPKLDLELSLSTSYAESDTSLFSQGLSPFHNSACSPLVADNEGSTYSLWKIGRHVPPFLMPYTLQNKRSNTPLEHSYSHMHKVHVNTTPVHPQPSQAPVNAPPNSNPSTCGVTHKQPKRTKTCRFEECTKGARGATGLCISHGGGTRCQRAWCQRGAEGKTVFCKAHGGGRRCQNLGCTKSAEGQTDYCIGHGGGRRCGQEGCLRASRGKSGLCIRHGGGKRCTIEDCRKSAEGISGKCIAHGGGRRCQHPGCTKGAQGSTMLCKAHGGGRRCVFLGCKRGAEGSTHLCKGHGGGKRCTHEGGCTKSVHGGTLFCVRHGGGKRCGMAGCTKSARGRTSFCVRHGGGKRCKHEGCGNSAQGKTDFCKSHGGGKRCSWGDQSDVSCDRFSRVRSGLCSAHSSQVQTSTGSESLSFVGNGSLVRFSLPEGRVHGGNLM